jgi:hypothetical protein
MVLQSSISSRLLNAAAILEIPAEFASPEVEFGSKLQVLFGGVMKRRILMICSVLAICATAAVAQEFRTTPRVAPQPIPPRAPSEQNSNSDWYKKFRAARNKAQLLNPAAPREYGSGEQVVSADPVDPKERPKYLKLFSFAF